MSALFLPASINRYSSGGSARRRDTRRGHCEVALLQSAQHVQTFACSEGSNSRGQEPGQELSHRCCGATNVSGVRLQTPSEGVLDTASQMLIDAAQGQKVGAFNRTSFRGRCRFSGLTESQIFRKQIGAVGTFFRRDSQRQAPP